MTDQRNIVLAWLSTATSIATVPDLSRWLPFLSAIVLPIVFFAVGKTVDVLLQIYFRRRAERYEQAIKETSRRENGPQTGQPTV